LSADVPLRIEFPEVEDSSALEPVQAPKVWYDNLTASEFQSGRKGEPAMTAKLVEYLTTTRLGERGTMTLPKEYRDALNLGAGAPMTVLRIGDGIILMPEQKRFDRLCDSIAARLERAGVSEAELQATLPDVREELTRRRYPGLFARKNKRKSRAPRRRVKR